jgi:acyl carrier protein
MTLSLTQQICGNEGIQVGEIRALVAKHLHVDVERVTDEAHLSDDLGADWLNRLELLILIEERFIDVEFPDGNSDQIETVGDLIRYIRDARVDRADSQELRPAWAASRVRDQQRSYRLGPARLLRKTLVR